MIIGFLILGIPVMTAVSLIFYAPIYLINKRKYGKQPFARHLAVFVLIGVLISFFYATLLVGGITLHPRYHLINLHPFIWVKETYAMGVRKMAEQLLLNAGMLVPLGFILPVVSERMRKWYRTAGTIFLLVLSVETLQYFIGRSADVDDLILNAAGGILGYGIFCLCDSLFCQKTWWIHAKGEDGQKRLEC